MFDPVSVGFGVVITVTLESAALWIIWTKAWR